MFKCQRVIIAQTLDKILQFVVFSLFWGENTTTKFEKINFKNIKNKYNLVIRDPICCVIAQPFLVFSLFLGEKTTTRRDDKPIISDLSLTSRDLQTITQFCLLFYVLKEHFYTIQCAVFLHLESFNNDENYLTLLNLTVD